MTREPGRLTVSTLPPRLQVKAWSGALRLHKALGARLATPIDLWITDNRSVLFSIKHKGGRCALRLHHMFTLAEGDTREALITLASPEAEPRLVKWARAQLRAFSETHNEEIRLKTPKRRVRLKTSGDVHDLGPMLEAVLGAHFEPGLGLSISWGRWGRPHQHQSRIRLGSFDLTRGLIRIHPVLDQHGVPDWVVKFIIFHEVLHRVVPSRRRAGASATTGRPSRPARRPTQTASASRPGSRTSCRR